MVSRHVIRTVLCEAGLELSFAFLVKGRFFMAKLLHYDLSNLKAISPGFNLSVDTKKVLDGKPVVPINGLQKTTDFTLS